MLVNLTGGATAWLIGDPHLGRQFEAGVPLDRRGEREARQLQKFKDNLDKPDCQYVVVMGDLFDHPYVGFSVVLDAYNALANAAALHQGTQYIVLAGNHDMPRNIEAVGAFHMLETLCHQRIENLHVLAKANQIGPIACYPWQWNLPAAQQEILAPVSQMPVDLIVGHWDLQIFGENTDHLCPTKLLVDRYGEDTPKYGGHYHVPGVYMVDGHPVICTGSMEPYSHGEDPDGEVYVTMTPEQIAATNPAELHDKCVRVLLREGEEMPVGLDCMALTPKRVIEGEQELSEVKLGSFDWSEILESKIGELPVHVQTFIKERLQHGL